jgi:predicted XRE-type DNA-binding protein
MKRQTVMKSPVGGIVRGSGNAFADLSLPDAEERQTKLRLALALNTVIDVQRLTQEAAAVRLGLNQPKVSAQRNYKLEGFSVERLMTLLNALDRDVEIVIRKKPRSRSAARLRANELVNRTLADLNHYRASCAKARQPALRDDDRVAQLLVRSVEIATEHWGRMVDAGGV